MYRAQSTVVAAAFGCALLALGCGDDRPAASCTPACLGGSLCCAESGGNFCRATASDVRNCGGCGIACNAGESCSGGRCVGGGTDGMIPRPDGGEPGMCTPTCSSAQRCCGTTCVNRSVTPGADGRTDSSFMNCNGCGIACDPMRASACAAAAGGPPSCQCGTFTQCMVGEVCVAESGSFRCVNLSNDRNNCGTIGNRCTGDEICVGGSCVCGSTGAACSGGLTCCGGTCTDTQTNGSHCGGCGMACGAQGPDCVAGSCRCGSAPACAAPSGTSLGASCCSGSCVPNSNTSCGCGVVCDDGDMCIVAGGLPGLPGGMGLCCGFGFPGIGGVCTDFPTFDAGFPTFDAGLPFP